MGTQDSNRKHSRLTMASTGGHPSRIRAFREYCCIRTSIPYSYQARPVYFWGCVKASERQSSAMVFRGVFRAGGSLVLSVDLSWRYVDILNCRSNGSVEWSTCLRMWPYRALGQFNTEASDFWSQQWKTAQRYAPPTADAKTRPNARSSQIHKVCPLGLPSDVFLIHKPLQDCAPPVCLFRTPIEATSRDLRRTSGASRDHREGREVSSHSSFRSEGESAVALRASNAERHRSHLRRRRAVAVASTSSSFHMVHHPGYRPTY